MATATAPPAQRAGPPAPREMVTIRARDKATGKDLIITVPRGASMDEVMAAYTAKFNAQEGKSLARDEFRFVSNGATVGGGDRVGTCRRRTRPTAATARARRAAPPATTTTTTTTLTPLTRSAAAA